MLLIFYEVRNICLIKYITNFLIVNQLDYKNKIVYAKIAAWLKAKKKDCLMKKFQFG